MENFREDGTVISETNINRTSSLSRDEDCQKLKVFNDELGNISGDQTNAVTVSQFQELESSEDECPSDIGEIFGDDWLGKPGVSSESEPEDVCKSNAHVEPKKKRVMGRPIPSNITIVEGEPVKYSCTVCVKTFMSKCHIRYHAYCGQSEKPFKCNLCSKSFSKKSLLDYHIKTHTGERPYSCTMCERTFLQLDKLKRHERKHLGNYLKCDQCDKKFRDSNSLNVHKRSHFDSNSSNIKCNTCSKIFKSKSALNVHVRAIHSSSKQFFCEHCGKGFDWKYNLVCHVRTHSGIRAYSCNECNKTFKNQQDCCKHRLTHTDNKQYQCQVCEGTFKRRDNLIRHLRNIHPEEEIKIIKIPMSSKPASSSEEKGSSKDASQDLEDVSCVKSRLTPQETSEKRQFVSNIVFSGSTKSVTDSKVLSESCETPGDRTRTNSSNIINRESTIMPGESDKIPYDLSRVPTESSKIPNESYRNQITNIRFFESGRGDDYESTSNNPFYSNIRFNKHFSNLSGDGHLSDSRFILNDSRQTREFNHQSNYLHRSTEGSHVANRGHEHYLLEKDQGNCSRDSSISNFPTTYFERPNEVAVNPNLSHYETGSDYTSYPHNLNMDYHHNFNMDSHVSNNEDFHSLNNADPQRISVIRNLSPSQPISAHSSVIKHSGSTNSQPPPTTPPSSSRECVIKSTKP